MTLELIVGRTYRGKNVAQSDGLVNDRTIKYIGADFVQYDGPAVKNGRHYPKVSHEAFLKWASHDVTDELPVGEYQTWASYRASKAKIKASLKDERPTVPHEQAMAEADALIDKAEQKPADDRPPHLVAAQTKHLARYNTRPTDTLGIAVLNSFYAGYAYAMDGSKTLAYQKDMQRQFDLGKAYGEMGEPMVAWEARQDADGQGTHFTALGFSVEPEDGHWVAKFPGGSVPYPLRGQAEAAVFSVLTSGNRHCIGYVTTMATKKGTIIDHSRITYEHQAQVTANQWKGLIPDAVVYVQPVYARSHDANEFTMGAYRQRGYDEYYNIANACVWRRRDEWVLELEGTINDTNFTVRYPVSADGVNPEDVPSMIDKVREEVYRKVTAEWALLASDMTSKLELIAAGQLMAQEALDKLRPFHQHCKEITSCAIGDGE